MTQKIPFVRDRMETARVRESWKLACLVFPLFRRNGLLNLL